MADRRMFSKAITNSAKFLKMPLETQALYFHLAQNADDDGVAEGFSTMRLIGANEDSLRILSAKGYIKILNEDLVIFIIDWLEHNKIRADRKKNSVYKELLLESVPDVKLIAPKERSDLKKNNCNKRTTSGRPVDNKRTTNWQPMDGIGKDRLGKDRLGEDRQKEKSVVGQSVNIDESINFYNKNIGMITNYVADEIESFIQDGIEEALVIKAMKKALDAGKGNWGYTKGILNNCYKENIKTVEEFDAKEMQKNNNKVKQTVSTETKKEYTVEDFEEFFYKNK